RDARQHSPVDGRDPLLGGDAVSHHLRGRPRRRGGGRRNVDASSRRWYVVRPWRRVVGRRLGPRYPPPGGALPSAVSPDGRGSRATSDTATALPAANDTAAPAANRPLRRRSDIGRRLV